MRPGRMAALGVVPYAIVVTVLLLVPALGILQLSFETSTGAGDGYHLRNYARILEPYYFAIIWRTVRLALVATVFELVLALPVAYMLARATPGMKAFLTLCVMIPLMTSVVVKAFGWYILLSEEGSLSGLIHASGIYDMPVVGTQFAVVLAMVEFGLPFMILSLATAFEKVPRNLEEAGLNLHASPLRVFWYILLPLIKPGILSGFLLCFGVSASAYVIPAMLGGTKVKMAAQVIFDDVMVAFNWPGAAAVSIVLLVVLSAILYISLVLGRAQNEARA